MNERLRQFNIKISGRRGYYGYHTLQKLENARVSKR